MRRDAFRNTRHLRGFAADLAHRPGFDVGSRLHARKKPLGRLLDFVVLAQQFQEARAEDGVAVFGALTLFDADQHAAAFDVFRHLGAELGFFGILHTWGQNLLHHPHIHFVIPGGGISPDLEWVSCQPGFFLPVKVLSRLFRRLFLTALREAFPQSQLQFFGEIEALKEELAFRKYLALLEQAEWVVYAKKPFGGPQKALDYLGRYTHRVALSNDRILRVANGEVTFQWRDYRSKDQYKSRAMTVPADEFIRRFLIHTLPPGFRRIRFFGFLTNRFRKEKLALCRRLLSNPITDLLPAPAECRAIEAVLAAQNPRRCPKCRTGILIRIFLAAYRWPERPPDSS
jgi:hypothetical protein